MILVVIALSYPVLSVLKLFPKQMILEVANFISEDRAQSLKFRFENEEQLLDRALERPVFGWGRYGRNRVYNNDTGKDESTTDGAWLITIGGFGLFGFVAQFGLLCIGVLRSAGAAGSVDTKDDRMLLSTLCLIVAINIIDLLPNASLTPWLWLLGGALLGRAEALRSLGRQTIRSSKRAFVRQPGFRFP